MTPEHETLLAQVVMYRKFGQAGSLLVSLLAAAVRDLDTRAEQEAALADQLAEALDCVRQLNVFYKIGSQRKVTKALLERLDATPPSAALAAYRASRAKT